MVDEARPPMTKRTALDVASSRLGVARAMFSAATVALMLGKYGAQELAAQALREVDQAQAALDQLRVLGRDYSKAVGPRRHAEHRRTRKGAT